jgi:FkbM family methyltransferase
MSNPASDPGWPWHPLSGRALTRLRSGEPICVDLASMDALPYLFGVENEPEVTAVFRALLRSDSVVLDIGANFGLYTAIAGAVVRRRGRLYAFEANPRVYQCLLTTIVANRLWPGTRTIPANLLVSDRCGRGTLFFMPDELGGGTMTDVRDPEPERRSVEVDMTTIDACLPPGTVVDLVKIDVEGHEPAVIRGMAQTIARSPKIRLIVEFVPAFLAHTTSAETFFREIRSLGFEVCQVLPGPILRHVAAAAELPEFSYCLLTRTPRADAARVERYCASLRVRIRRWLEARRPRRRIRKLATAV